MMKALLRFRRKPRVLMLQTSDTDIYAPMLAIGERANRAYCESQGFEYRSFVGLKRGHYSWHATYNRIPLIKEIMDEGYRGWVLYLDADAYVRDLAFDIRQIISWRSEPLIADTAGRDDYWAINAGVFLLNLGDPRGRKIAATWHADFMAISDDDLVKARRWYSIASDQGLLHNLLRRDVAYRNAVRRAPPQLLNYHNGTFVRQYLREFGPFSKRVAVMEQDIAEILTRWELSRDE
jgi:hypothetical protein